MQQTLIQIPQYGIAISLIDLAISMVLALSLGIFVVLVYRYTHRGLSYEQSFPITLVMMPPIVAIIMMLIGSNLALSLGMVGALSIIRFRTVIKDSRDMIFLFWTIAVGLGCGTYNWKVIMLASLFMGISLCTLYFFGYGMRQDSDYVLVLSGKTQSSETSLKDIVSRHVSFSKLRSLDINENGWEMVFELRSFKDGKMNANKIVGDLRKVEGVDAVSLLAPQLALPV